jgi:hypothetical protein
MGQAGAAQRTWLPSDSALWHTCRIVTELITGSEPALVATTFAPAEGERVWAAGSLAIDEFGIAGDGSYMHHGTGALLGYGKIGVAFTAASVVGTAFGNARRKRAAIQAATPAWHRMTAGGVFVTNYGFRIQDQTGIFFWDWGSIEAMEVNAYNVVSIQGRSENGPVHWRLLSEWAELIFVLWAMNRNPQHPQLRHGGWIPPGWIPWAASQGFPPPVPPGQGGLTQP